MDPSNKENSQHHLNKAVLFSNPFISQKISPQPSPELTADISTDSTIAQYCQKHLKPIGSLFCVQCLSYQVCSGCIPEEHASHEVMHFPSSEELISGTKETILESLEETLKQLKSRENQVKNRCHEIDLVRKSLRGIEEQIVQIISGLFREIEGRLTESLNKVTTRYEQEADKFFREFNNTNDILRENLMVIIEGEIDIKTFNKEMVVKVPPKMPDFARIRSSLEGFKKVFRDVKNQVSNAKAIVENAVFQESNLSLNESCHSRFDKYLEGKQKQDKVNESFMKTMKLLGGNKDLGSLKASLSRRPPAATQRIV